jgi:hypothetical protein
LILTEWKEFAQLDLAKLHAGLKYPIVLDGRNLYRPEQMAAAGLIYHSIGRASGVPEHMTGVIDRTHSGLDGTPVTSTRRQ